MAFTLLGVAMTDSDSDSDCGGGLFVCEVELVLGVRG